MFEGRVRLMMLVVGLLGSQIAMAGFLDSLQDVAGKVGDGISDVGGDVVSNVVTKVVNKPGNTSSNKTAKVLSKVNLKLEVGEVYRGYSDEYRELHKLMYSGDFNRVNDLYVQALEDKAKKAKGFPEIDFDSGTLSMLHRLEHGTLAVDSGNVKSAVTSFGKVRALLDDEENQGTLTSGGFGALMFGVETLSGNEELKAFKPEGYEKVLMLNYQAIAYLLNGQDKAYNVSRMATDWQNKERKALAERINAAKKEFAKEQNKLSKEGAGSKEGFGAADILSILPSVTKVFGREYKKHHKKANTVTSAYVNPFGSYLSGVVMEFDAYSDSSSVDDSLRAYKQALKLNPKSKVIKQAVKDLKKVDNSGSGGMKANERLLHVIVADGFVPEKKVLTSLIPLGGLALPVELPLLDPVSNRVARIDVKNANGKVLANLSVVADVEAMALRYQKDLESENNLRVIATLARSYYAQKGASSFIPGGQFLASKLLEEFTYPDTRAWSNLPSKLYAVRIKPKAGDSVIYVSSYDRNNRRIARKKVKLNSGHNFVYARSAAGKLNAHVAKKLWVN